MNLKTILIVAGALVVILILPSLLVPEQNKETTKKETKKDTIKIPNYNKQKEIKNYTDTVTWNDLKKTFMSGCNEDGQQLEFCECSFNYVKNNYTKSEFMEISLDMVSGGSVPSELLLNIVEKCPYN